MGRFGEQPKGEILFDYEERPEATGERDGGLGADFRRDRPRAAAGGPEVIIVRRLGKLWERMRATVRNEPVDLEFQAADGRTRWPGGGAGSAYVRGGADIARGSGAGGELAALRH